MRPTMKLMFVPAFILMSIPAVAAAAGYGSGSFTNGSFELDPNGKQITVASQLGSGTGFTSLQGWTTSTYGFLMTPGSADTTGAYSPTYSNTFSLWGSHNGGVNTLPATSPDKGNFLALDAAGGYNGSGISQTITGLTVGQQYLVSFYWASGQQYGYTGATDEWLQVSFGKQVQTTAAANNVNHGFTDWAKQTFAFTADATSDTLNFLAMSHSGGLPPIVLLDGVSFNAVPEPGSLALVGLGLGVAAVSHRLRRRAPAA